MRVRRGDLHDVYIEGDKSVVMAGQQVVVLSELATTILESVPPAASVAVADVVSEVVAKFGPPKPPRDADSLTREHIHDLAAHQVLVVDEVDEEVPLLAPFKRDEQAASALHSAMAAVLAPAPNARWSVPDDVAPQAFLAEVRRQRVSGQVATGLHRLDLPSGLRAQLQADSDGMRFACHGLARDLHRVLDVLAAAGVPALVFKGLALAAQAWGDEAARGYGDLDILVAPADLAQAHRILVADGWQPPMGYPEPGASWGWRQFVRTSHEMPFSSGSTTLDLHWAALPSRSAIPDFDTLWRRRTNVAVMGRPVPTFSPYDALTHSASHSAKDHWRWLRGLADVHRLAASRETWSTVDRPLRADQLLSIGIAARHLGIPADVPPVVHRAVAASKGAAARSLVGQMGPEHAVIRRERDRVRLVLRSYVPLWRTRSGFTDLLRHVLRTALPPRLLAGEPSPRALIATLRLTAARIRELIGRGCIR